MRAVRRLVIFGCVLTPDESWPENLPTSRSAARVKQGEQARMGGWGWGVPKHSSAEESARLLRQLKQDEPAKHSQAWTTLCSDLYKHPPLRRSPPFTHRGAAGVQSSCFYNRQGPIHVFYFPSKQMKKTEK